MKEAWRGVVEGVEVKELSKLKGVKGEFRVGDEETVCLGHRRKPEGVLNYLNGGTWEKGSY